MHSTQKFSLKNFQPPVQIHDENTLSKLSISSFQYLGHGKQSMVFENKDEGVVLKLFYWKRPIRKYWYCRAENWIRFISPTWIYKRMKKKNSIRKLFQTYQWGFHYLQNETRIIGIHFEKTSDPIPICLVDRQKKLHTIDLASTSFVIQQKAKLIPEYLQTLDPKAVKTSLQRLQDLIFSRIDKGFIDQRQVFKSNYGFIGDDPIQIDVGKIKKMKNFNREKEKEKIRKSLEKYIRKSLKTLFPTLDLNHEELDHLDLR